MREWIRKITIHDELICSLLFITPLREERLTGTGTSLTIVMTSNYMS